MAAESIHCSDGLRTEGQQGEMPTSENVEQSRASAVLLRAGGIGCAITCLDLAIDDVGAVHGKRAGAVVE